MLQQIDEPVPSRPPGLPLLRIGLRPFYLCSALTAALAIPLWMLVFLGQLPWRPALAPLWWHAHEMLYGFAVATIIGFLLSASRAWTGLGGSRGTGLGVLVLLWLAARIAVFTGPYLLYAALDLMLLPLVALVLVRMLLRSGHHRNLPLAGILLLLAMANLVFHLSVLQWLDLSPQQPLHAALGLIVLIECVMAGRVIPGFTISANPGLRITAWPWLETVTLVLTAAGLALWVAAPAHWARGTALVLALAAGSHVLRQWRWRPALTRHRPVLWVLHAAYVWIPVGLALLALAHAGHAPLSSGVHALAVGTTGGLIIGMMTRTARGHTGRSLKIGRLESLAYLLVTAAALSRVFPPWLNGEWYLPSLIFAASAWGLAFAIYLWIYTPWLGSTRADGRDG